jgi:hypothetical protein
VRALGCNILYLLVHGSTATNIDGQRDDGHSQSTRPAPVIRHDESGQPATYHESAVDVDADVTATTSSPLHQQPLRQITEDKSTADVSYRVVFLSLRIT